MSRLGYGKMSFSGGGAVLQDKSITSNGTYTADEGYDGIGTATVNVPNPSTGTVSITSNGTTDVTDYASASVNVQPTLQDKTITANGTYSADSGYDGLDEVTVNVPQPSGNINITTTAQTDVTNYATAQVVDADLVAGNIKKDVDILGVVGTYEGVEPVKGFIPTAYDSDGYVTSGKVVGMTEIPNYYFYAYTSNNSFFKRIVNIELPSGLTRISGGAFYCCESLALTSLPSGLTEIGGAAFNKCKSLALTSLPSGLYYLSGTTTFNECTSLALTTIPSVLTDIPNNTFTGCTGLTSMNFPSTLHTLGTGAFKNCTGLTLVTFNGKPTNLSSSAFSGCTNITDIYVPWAEGAKADAPWGATNATIHYNYTA